MEKLNSREIGAFIEEKTILYLKKNGYVIKERNFTAKFGEIDIVATIPEEKMVVFVEVKAKEESSGIHPFEAVDAKKQRRIIMASKEYMAAHRIEDCFIRFDVVGVTLNKGKIALIEVARDAFQCS